MRITDIEVIPLRIPDHNTQIADGIQDDVIVRVHTDEGITGVGEADSSPMVVKAVVEAWPSWPRGRSRTPTRSTTVRDCSRATPARPRYLPKEKARW